MSTLTLREHDGLPDGLLTAGPDELEALLGGPTLFHLPGRRPEPLLVSILLHGNEPSGLRALQRVLRARQGQVLPRACSVFVGNVYAARLGLRRLEGQPDYNRVWPGGEQPELAESALMRQVVERMRARGVFASIDIHNNTGLNPHYGCVNRLTPAFLHLARLFSRTVVYFRQPLGVQSEAMARLCPSVTVECGQAGSGAADAHAAELIEAALRLSHFPTHPVPAHDIDLFHTVAVVTVTPSASLSFDGTPATLAFLPELDHMNFRELPPGTPLARLAAGAGLPLQARDEQGGDVTRTHFDTLDGQLLTRRTVMPAMLTRDVRIVRQDCLCYFMERLGPPGSPGATATALQVASPGEPARDDAPPRLCKRPARGSD